MRILCLLNHEKRTLVLKRRYHVMFFFADANLCRKIKRHPPVRGKSFNKSFGKVSDFTENRFPRQGTNARKTPGTSESYF